MTWIDCDRCWHTHLADSPCMTRCDDCETELSDEIAALEIDDR